APPRAGPANKTPAPPKPLPHRVATADVNIRTGQGTDSQAVGQVAEGDTVVVLDDPAGGDWMRIRYQNVEGWVYAPLFEAR
ncbi:MAG: SH3 domain-containing protein, partial [Salinisphaera sp.]|nr:SH3 domain-containing protein [Salinisphaera sp.]